MWGQKRKKEEGESEKNRLYKLLQRGVCEERDVLECLLPQQVAHKLAYEMVILGALDAVLSRARALGIHLPSRAVGPASCFWLSAAQSALLYSDVILTSASLNMSVMPRAP